MSVSILAIKNHLNELRGMEEASYYLTEGDGYFETNMSHQDLQRMASIRHIQRWFSIVNTHREDNGRYTVRFRYIEE